MLEKQDSEVIVKSIIGLGSMLGLILVLFGWLTYLKLYDNKIEYVEWLFYRRKAEVSNITHITIEGGYYVLQSIIKMMFIYYTDKKGCERFLHISMSLYDTETLQQLLKDLLAINPNIKLDKATERILRTGKP